MLPKYSELTTVNRGAPCQEFPGEYVIYHLGAEVQKFSAECGEASAWTFFWKVVGAYDSPKDYSMCWSASDNDPRIGKTWMTGFYRLDTK